MCPLFLNSYLNANNVLPSGKQNRKQLPQEQNTTFLKALAAPQVFSITLLIRPPLKLKLGGAMLELM